MEDSKNLMRKLIDELKEASDAYYNKSQELMSNYTYDKKKDELKSLEDECGFRFNDSPTLKVGASIPKMEALKKIKHEYPAKSLDKTKDVQKMVKTFSDAVIWSSGKSLWEIFTILMWKLDGSTIQLTYQDGVLLSAATRGDGEVGVDITNNASLIEGIPVILKEAFRGRLTVRGEGTMTYEEFERVNSLIPDDEDKYMNPRNLAAASIKLLDRNDLAKRKITFSAFELVHYSGDEEIPSTFSGRLDLLSRLGCNIVPYICVPPSQLEEEIQKWTDNVESYEQPVDGLVCALNDCSITDGLQGTEHHPNVLKGYAFKWQDETAETILKEVEWSPSRTGRLNPVAIFDSVSLEGTTVSRASVHNFSIMKSLHLRIGDKISVYKANKIIPQIAENLSDNELPYSKDEEESIVGVCPHCGKKGKVITSKDGIESVYCMNPNCIAKLIFRFEHFCNRYGMNIEGLSEETLTKFIVAGYLKELGDLYRLDRYKDLIVGTSGFGERSWEKLWSSIQKSRKTSFIPFITAIGIPDVGAGQAKLLAKEFDYDVKKFFYAPITDLTYIKGIGDVLSEGILRWRKENVINSKENYEDTEIERLLDYLEFEKPDKEDNSDNKVLSGKTFVVTGKVLNFPNRDAIHKFIEDNGGKTSGSVTSKTSYLVNNDVSSTSGKNKKAHELGIPIISEDELMRLVKGEV